jgi:glycosyltransferase involved in cell wall biosynthesis
MGEARRVAAIVPAKNEAGRIANVLRAVTRCPLVHEVIVVDDGSDDDTAKVAASFPNVQVVRLPVNRGKAAAMWEGAHVTRAGVLIFLDADLGGLRPDHVERIVKPVLADECDMCVGILRRGRTLSNAAQRVTPYLSGQRAMKREIFEAVPNVYELRMGIEIALQSVAKQLKARVKRVEIRGVSNCYKEQKLGLMKGAAARLQMYGEITQAVMKSGARKLRPGGAGRASRRKRPPFRYQPWHRG